MAAGLGPERGKAQGPDPRGHRLHLQRPGDGLHPHITATGARTRLGILAVSRDLLEILPFGTKVRLKDLGTIYGRGKGQFDALFKDIVFVVADVMNARWRKKVDIWFPDRATALRFGRRKVQLEVVAYPE